MPGCGRGSRKAPMERVQAEGEQVIRHGEGAREDSGKQGIRRDRDLTRFSPIPRKQSFFARGLTFHGPRLKAFEGR